MDEIFRFKKSAKELLNWEPTVDLGSWIKEFQLINGINI